LNTASAVGRLDLEGDDLVRYVKALITNWGDAKAQVTKAVIWSDARGGPSDITRLMRESVAVPVSDDLKGDGQISVAFLDGAAGEATCTNLVETLTHDLPALVVTTSHGVTAPLDNPRVMRSQLGLPIDQAGQVLNLDQLLASWRPNGAIWYAHACCSAGADDVTSFGGLFDGKSDLDRTLVAIAQAGPITSPLPRALLGAEQPLRCFIGHVEPTFDWTLIQPLTRQVLTSELRKSLYNQLYKPRPVGLAFQQFYGQVATLETQHAAARRDYNKGQDSRDLGLYCVLAAIDIRTTVILGDPTVTLPRLP
jgi:hypothetical protein